MTPSPMTPPPGTPATTLFRDGRVRAPHHPGATALLVRGGALAWVGADPSEVVREADEVVDLADALVSPAFVDAHVHATSTGLALTGLDLTARPASPTA